MKAFMGALRSTASFLGGCVGAAWNFSSRVVGAPFMLMGAAGRYMAQFMSIASGNWKPGLDASAEEEAPRFEGLSQDMELEDFVEKVYRKITKYNPEQQAEIEAMAVMKYAREAMQTPPSERNALLAGFEPKVRDWLRPMEARELMKLANSPREAVVGHLSGERSIKNVMPIVREKRISDLAGTDKAPEVVAAKARRAEYKATKAARVEAKKSGQAVAEAAPGQAMSVEGAVIDTPASRVASSVKARMDARRGKAGPDVSVLPSNDFRPSMQFQQRYAGGGRSL